MLISLGGYSVWSAPFLLAYNIIRYSHNVTHLKSNFIPEKPGIELLPGRAKIEFTVVALKHIRCTQIANKLEKYKPTNIMLRKMLDKLKVYSMY